MNKSKLKNSQTGHGIIGIFVVILVLLSIAAIGWFVFQANSTSQESFKDTSRNGDCNKTEDFELCVYFESENIVRTKEGLKLSIEAKNISGETIEKQFGCTFPGSDGLPAPRIVLNTQEILIGDSAMCLDALSGVSIEKDGVRKTSVQVPATGMDVGENTVQVKWELGQSNELSFYLSEGFTDSEYAKCYGVQETLPQCERIIVYLSSEIPVGDVDLVAGEILGKYNLAPIKHGGNDRMFRIIPVYVPLNKTTHYADIIEKEGLVSAATPREHFE